MTSNTRAPKVLVVEDEHDIRELISLHLERDGCEVVQTEDGETGLSVVRNTPFDLYVLDWMLPGISGLEITRYLREREEASRFHSSILMVTARTESSDVIAGLDAGADDYIGKPFEIPVLMARVRALLRRRSQSTSLKDSDVLLAIGNLSLDLEAHEVRCCGRNLHLTRSEFKLLASLMENAGRVMTRQKLIDLVQGEGVSVVDRAVDTHVFGLRKKLDACGELIETVRGVGYRMRNG